MSFCHGTSEEGCCASKVGVPCARGCVARPERDQDAQSCVVFGGFIFWKSLKLMWGRVGWGVTFVVRSGLTGLPRLVVGS